jgi:beta-galactosidase GanA
MRALAQWMVQSSGVTPVLKDVPDGVEVCRRVARGKQVLIVINHTAAPQTIPLPRAMRDVLHDRAPLTTLTLAAGDVDVLLAQ